MNCYGNSGITQWLAWLLIEGSWVQVLSTHYENELLTDFLVPPVPASPKTPEVH